MLWEYTLSIWMLPPTLYERICCHISIYRQLKGTEYLLLKDLIIASKMLSKCWQNKIIKKSKLLEIIASTSQMLLLII
ncbi:hypothetical protein A6770_17950 [Nostoc minutum NIES-26]|uniref:Uncharacterized protein n=1 Tax=Nostoc minutum NIES-26 TaxID=1844469 RepID=A0A367RDR7_9NOSO|nr:hypothetical protein A6770_17950 [Nostoc minutum NIES-26]